MEKILGKDVKTNIILGIMVSNIGTMAFTYAISLFVLDVTESPIAAALMFLLSNIPEFLFAFASGIVADRFNKLKIIVRADQMRVVTGLLFLFLIPLVEDNLKIILLCFLMILVSLLETFQSTAYQAIIPDVVSSKEFVKLNTAINGVGEAINLISPTIGVLVYSFLGVNGLLLLMVGCITISLFYESKLPYHYVKPITPSDRKIGSMINSELTGVRKLLTSDLRITSLYVNGFITNLFLIPFVAQVPYLITRVFNGTNFEAGIVKSCTAMGGMIAVLFIRPFKKLGVAKNIFVGIIGMVLGSLLFTVMINGSVLSAFISNPVIGTAYIAFVILFIYLSFGYYGIYFSSFLQQNISKNSLGKGISIVMMVNSLGRIFGAALFGVLLTGNLTVPIIVLVLGMASKIFIHVPFIMTDNKMRNEKNTLDKEILE